MKKRSIILALLFSLITFGLYYLYWFVSLTNGSNKLAPKHATAGGILAWFLSIITCGIYMFYWYYRMGQKAGEMNNTSSEGILYLLLGMFTFGFVPVCLGQSAMNKALKAANPNA
ncbi:MAG: DUF4234 domain-containing protein [Clostridiales bacterium]|nr:DUF4234 domain-containing protein [Clostridiales bacterium]